MGGAFDLNIPKTLPGTYINFASESIPKIEPSSRGTVIIPLANAKYGPGQQFIEITASEASQITNVLGYSVYDSSDASMLLIREALKCATSVFVYNLAEGTKATVTCGNLTATAKYGGSRGNDFKIVIASNPVDGFDVTVYLASSKTEKIMQVSTVADLIAAGSNYLTFTGDGALEATAGVSLSSGADASTSTDNLTTFLDALENINYQAVAFPISGLTDNHFASIKSKCDYLRTTIGKSGQFVVSGYAGDHEGIINVTNGVVLTDGTQIDAVKATAWVAGVTAGAKYNESNTYRVYDGAASVLGIKSKEKAEKAIASGELFFGTNLSNEVVIVYDINSLVTITDVKNESFKKNRFIRVIDNLLVDLQTEFSPAKFDNNSEGWDRMEGIGRTILKAYQEDNAIDEVNEETDFLVDRNRSTGDGTYINIGIKPVDSAEKIYISVKTS